MKGGSFKKLAEIASAALCAKEPILNREIAAFGESAINQLQQVLKEKNGFYAFESALHVFPSEGSTTEIGLGNWNSAELWRAEYKEMTEDCLFFAENVFGDQFCLKNDNVFCFDAETGGVEKIATNLDHWARSILIDYAALTGFPLAHEWQKANGPIPPGMRLVPKVPFVAGGEYLISNLYLLDSVKAMRFRGDMAVQIRDLPDGSKIKFKIVE